MRPHRLALTLVLAAGLCGCLADRHVTPGFGNAVRQDLAAQITNPNPDYRHKPGPPANGDRVGLAMQRYRTGKVLQPTVTASQVGVISESNTGAGASVGATAGP